MSFVFRAGPSSYVFPEPLAREVNEALERRLGFISDSQYNKLETFIGKLSPPGLVPKPGTQVFCSKELPPGSWAKLQQSAAGLLDPTEIHHLRAVNSGRGAYVADLSEPETIQVNRTEALQVAGLSNLIRELLAYASSAGLPVEGTELRRAQGKSSDSATTTYVELMLAAQFALRAGCALWLIE